MACVLVAAMLGAAERVPTVGAVREGAALVSTVVAVLVLPGLQVHGGVTGGGARRAAARRGAA
eukprot:1946179-Lingulodinium_polyedra.AAC.1